MVSLGGVVKEAYWKITEEKRRTIEAAALKEFAAEGYQQASLNTIIAAAGISKGGLYKYCSSKEELYRYIIKKSLSDMKPLFSMLSDGPGVQSVRAFIQGYCRREFAFYAENPLYYRLHTKAFSPESLRQDPALQQLITEGTSSIYESLRALIPDPITCDLYLWTLQGLNQRYMNRLSKIDPGMSLDEVSRAYSRELELYLYRLEAISQNKE